MTQPALFKLCLAVLPARQPRKILPSPSRPARSRGHLPMFIEEPWGRYPLLKPPDCQTMCDVLRLISTIHARHLAGLSCFEQYMCSTPSLLLHVLSCDVLQPQTVLFCTLCRQFSCPQLRVRALDLCCLTRPRRVHVFEELYLL